MSEVRKPFTSSLCNSFSSLTPSFFPIIAQGKREKQTYFRFYTKQYGELEIRIRYVSDRTQKYSELNSGKHFRNVNCSNEKRIH
jgi:hypothetical protein